ncbi:outer membrane beta-barrel protein [Tenacibaculum sp. 1_MG-2023]|uniref:outer membrane beta-barrel protein n=1 Tax=Tenacibaculum sp. 1_MG-2023 TaxID=3062653 RepID=UPI0026E17DF9|nr:outer membrane beta-barrel protein [Tenacibaculum sp. 1_MG-2023]MDO6601020.1 outer membrane beta-barrel protein [Tenacibaculum sp. 1_MG-2023]
MKKLLLSIALVAFTFAATAQDGKFNLGVNLGLPTGDVSDFYSFVGSIEANYLFDVSEEFQVGPSASYSHFFGEEGFGDISFLPLAAAARFNASEQFVLGADLGYAIGISPDENDGGFYYRPMVGYNLNDKVMLQVSYSGVSMDGGSFANFGLGAMFAL